MTAAIPAGILATVTMDVAMVLASRAGAFSSDKTGLEPIGRWAGNVARGRASRADISAEPRLRGELALGLATHYLTGIVLTQAYLTLLRRANLRPDVAKATAYGLATSVLPLLISFPSMGPWLLRSAQRRCPPPGAPHAGRARGVRPGDRAVVGAPPGGRVAAG